MAAASKLTGETNGSRQQQIKINVGPENPRHRKQIDDDISESSVKDLLSMSFTRIKEKVG